MYAALIHTLDKNKYVLLLTALVAHLYIGIFLTDLDFYTGVIWPANMIVLGIASVGVFIKTSRIKKGVQNVFWILAVLLPLSIPFFGDTSYFMAVLSLFYCIFFGFIFFEIIRFLIKPSYINIDIISAAACGYFLLIEISVFLLQVFYYNDPGVLSNMDATHPAAIYMNLVYFSSIAITSIGFGDITPLTHAPRLIVSLFGVISQFYAVVLVGIIISKFVSEQDLKS